MVDFDDHKERLNLVRTERDELRLRAELAEHKLKIATDALQNVADSEDPCGYARLGLKQIAELGCKT